MPDELTPEALAELRQRLQEKRTHLKDELRTLGGRETEEGATSGSGSDFAGDAGDDSVDLDEIDRDVQTGDVLRRDLAEIEHALAKFDAGTYGVSEASGRPIPLARLRVLPEARYNVDEASAQQP